MQAKEVAYHSLAEGGVPGPETEDFTANHTALRGAVHSCSPLCLKSHKGDTGEPDHTLQAAMEERNAKLRVLRAFQWTVNLFALFLEMLYSTFCKQVFHAKVTFPLL